VVAAVVARVAPVVINREIMEFSEKNILISGGSSGIGLALAEKFALMNANVTILARDRRKLQQALDLLEAKRVSSKQTFDIISADVSQFETLTKSLDQKNNFIDILINSAGMAYPGKFMDLSADIFHQLIEINYLGTVYLTKLITPGMISRKNGYVVIISSLAALIGIYGYTAYAPTKFALRGFSKCMRSELKPFNIHVSVVFPPDTDTPQLAFERSIMPDITRKINQGGGVMSAEKVADAIIAGMQKNRFNIFPGFEGKILNMFSSLVDLYFYHYASTLAKKELG